jgi:hypothetical protein
MIAAASMYSASAPQASPRQGGGQTDVCFGKGVDKRLATRAINVAVQPDAEDSRVGHFAGEKLFTRDFCNIGLLLALAQLADRPTPTPRRA